MDDNKDIHYGIKALKRTTIHLSKGLYQEIKKSLQLKIKMEQKMIKKVKKLIFKWCLNKISKKKQDLRIDLPTVGLETFKQCKKLELKELF